MEAIKRRRLVMGMTTRDYALSNAPITSTLPNFTANATVLQNTITQIQTVAELQDFEKTGIKDNKNLLKATACTLTADTSRKLAAYALFTTNVTLLKEIKISEWELKRINDTDLKTKMQEVYDRAQTNIAALATYNVTPASQTALLNAINAFNGAIPKPRLGIDEKKQATQQLAVLFKTFDVTLENMDAAVEIVRLSQANFYNGYRTARKVIGSGTGSLALKIKAKNASTQKPEPNVTLLLTLTDETRNSFGIGKRESVLKTTAAGGGSQFKVMADGVYTLTAKKNGFKEVVKTVNVVDGEMTVVEIEMVMN